MTSNINDSVAIDNLFMRIKALNLPEEESGLFLTIVTRYFSRTPKFVTIKEWNYLNNLLDTNLRNFKTYANS